MLNIVKAPKGTVGSSKDSAYLVRKGDRVVGFITKAPNTKYDIHPYKVFRVSDGKNPATLLSSFYADADSVKIGKSFDYNTCNIGGKTAAFVFARRNFKND